jgi:hypothetical protein
MPDVTALNALLAKVKAGEAPSYEDWRGGFDNLLDRPSEHYYPILRDQARLAFMGSLDAAKRLHEAVLPGWWLKVFTHPNLGFDVQISSPRTGGNVAYENSTNTCIARAWLIAILKALISEAEQ